MPSTPGSIRSSTTRSKAVGAQPVERLAAVGHGGGLQPLEAEVQRDQLADVGVVFDDQDVGHGWQSCARSNGTTDGGGPGRRADELPQFFHTAATRAATIIPSHRAGNGRRTSDMKTLLRVTVAAGVPRRRVVALTPMFAQDGPPQGGPDARAGAGRSRWARLRTRSGRAVRHARRAGPRLRQLELTDTQREQVRGVMQSHQAEFRAIGDRMRTAHEALQRRRDRRRLRRSRRFARGAPTSPRLRPTPRCCARRCTRKCAACSRAEQQEKAKELKAAGRGAQKERVRAARTPQPRAAAGLSGRSTAAEQPQAVERHRHGRAGVGQHRHPQRRAPDHRRDQERQLGDQRERDVLADDAQRAPRVGAGEPASIGGRRRA